jgi:glycosyltransferase involved in cell wall biosynthesis
MKVLLLADPSSSHTIKWANALVANGIDVFLFGLSEYDSANYHADIKIETFETPSYIKNKLRGNILKSVYLSKLPALKRVIKIFKPDLLHSHYAASYGLLGALTGFHPFINSIWGIDISIFPKISFLHRHIIKYTLRSADALTATSIILSKDAKSYTDKTFTVIPFGIDLNAIKPTSTRLNNEGADIVIGTVKRLEHKYGLGYLLNAFALLIQEFPDLKLKLLIVGSGSLENKLRELAKKLKVNTSTVFTGSVPHSKISEYHNMMDIEVYLSDFEGFGVSVIEASACEKPVVVSNVGGLPEVVAHNETGILVPPKNPEVAAKAISSLVRDKELRLKYGKAGRAKVEKEYNWNENVAQMINLYNTIVKN